MAEQPEASVLFGVFNETTEHEQRVALTPDIVARLRKHGVTCMIEHDAGNAAQYTDADYEHAGATVSDRSTLLAQCDAFGFVSRPTPDQIAAMHAGQWVLGLLFHGQRVCRFAASCGIDGRRHRTSATTAQRRPVHG